MGEPAPTRAGARGPSRGPASEGAPPRHVLLVGMMGSGKTTVGHVLAEHLGRPFFDSDALVVEATGRTVPEIFATEGEAAFRRAEAEALRRALGSRRPAVVAVAGGAVLSAENRRRLREGGVVVWLRARPSTLARRVGSGEGRPLLADAPDGPLGALERLDALRRPLYEEVADVVVDVDDRPPAEVAAFVATWLASGLHVPERGVTAGEDRPVVPRSARQ